MSSLPAPLRKVANFVLLTTGMTLLFYVTFYNINRRWEPLPLQPEPLIVWGCDSSKLPSPNWFFFSEWSNPECGGKGDSLDRQRLPYWVRYRGPNTVEALRMLDIRIKQGMNEAYELSPEPTADILDVALVTVRLTLQTGNWIPFFDDSAGKSWLIWNPYASGERVINRIRGIDEGFRIRVDSSLYLYVIRVRPLRTVTELSSWIRRIRDAGVDTFIPSMAIAIPAVRAYGQSLHKGAHYHREYLALMEFSAHYAPLAYRTVLRRIRQHYPVHWYGEGGTLFVAGDSTMRWWVALYMNRMDQWHP